MLQSRNAKPKNNREAEHNKKLSVKRSLLDVTDSYAPLPQIAARRPTPRPRRKPDTPRGTAQSSSRPALPSLPPSSPPSASSVDQLISNLGSEFESDVVPVVASAIIDEGSGVNSDPFGFFAVENKLKILRTQQAQYRSAPPLQIQTTCDSSIYPPTPPKRRHKRRGYFHLFTPKESDSEAASTQSSPSPSKPISRKGKERALATLPVIVDEASCSPVMAVLPNVPRHISKRSCNLNRSGKVLSPQKSACTSDRVANLGTTRTARGKQPKKTRKSRAKVTEIDDKEQEKRQARLEYFNKLEAYQVEKENVYVV